jgi:hypothetical protein
VVDRNDRLHLVSTVVGTARKHPDSLGFTFLLTHNDGQLYNFAHEPGLRPYIFDFTETNQGGWKVTVIDSMSSEGPGRTVGSDGYNDNPWDVGGASGTDKVDTEARIQLSRTPDGRYIVYTWAESDTAYTFQGRKWNSLPNVKARMAEVGPEVPNVVAGLTVHPTEINLTAPGSATVPPYTFHLRVQDRATCHFVSPKCAVISNTASSGVALGLPLTVSNNSFVPMKQASPVTHWYFSANLNFDNVATVDFPTTSTVNCIIGVSERGQKKDRSSLYPNPGRGVGQLLFYATDVQVAKITVMNNLGQPVHSAEYTTHQGENDYRFDLSRLGSGSYFVTLEVNGKTSTHKLLITE